MTSTLDAWARDFVHAAHNLLRAPGFTIVTALTLALAIGANTAIFSVVDAVLLDPLPFPESDRLVTIRGSAPGSDLPEQFGPGPEFYVEYHENASMLEDLGMYDTFQTTMRTDERTDRLFGGFATPSFFSTLRATPVVGRLPGPDDQPFTVVLISHWLWMSWFGGDPAVIGQPFEIGGDQRTIIGVMGPEFRFLDERIAAWIHADIGDPDGLEPGDLGFGLVGRMTPGTRHDDLANQLTMLARRLPERFGGSANYARLIEQHRAIVLSLEEDLVGDIARPLWLVLGTVGIVLLIACSNVANLFMVRAESRRMDLAVRRALGAGRASLVRTQMAEALILATLGGSVGALLAWAFVPVLVRSAPEGVPNLDLVGVNGTALLFTLGVSLLAACAFGLAPALRFSNPGLTGGLRQVGGVGASQGRLGRNALVVVQTASALVLLVGAGLLVRSFLELTRIDPGYTTENIFTFQIAPEGEGFDSEEAYARFHRSFMQRLEALPGVESVGLTLLLPLDEGAANVRIVTQNRTPGALPPLLRMTAVGGDYFGTMDIALVRGRYFEPADDVPGVTSAIVSRAAAEMLWPGEDPLDRRFRMANDTTTWLTVVGVVEDIFLDNFRQAEHDPMIYLPLFGPVGVGSPAYVVRSPRAEVIAADIRSLVCEAAPMSPMYRIFTMRGLADRSMAELSFTMLLLATAAGLALVLGAVGLYGVLSYVVTKRTREIAVRMALGAQAQGLRRMVVGQGAAITLLGVVVGLAAALALTRVLESLLFGIGRMDVSTFALTAAVMLTVALLASYIPARRASSVDPMQALRAE